MGAPSITNNGKGSRNRTRNRKQFRENMDAIDFSKRATPARKPVKVKGGKKTYSFG